MNKRNMERFYNYNVPADLMHNDNDNLSVNLCIKSAGTLVTKMIMFASEFYAN